MLLFLSLLACGGPKSDADCITYYDTCESGCELICGSIDDADAANENVCDLACLDSGGEESEPAQCVYADGECVWASE